MLPVKGIKLMIISVLLASLMMPFTVFADTITSGITTNYYLKDKYELSSGNYSYLYEIEYILPDNYLGWVSFTNYYTYYFDSNSPSVTSSFTKAIYFNGNKGYCTFLVPSTLNASNGQGVLNSVSITINNSNVTKKADLSTLDDILNVLNDIKNIIDIDVMDELQDIVTELQLGNDYLNIISNLRQYNIPIESFGSVSYPFMLNYELYDIQDLYSYQYPIFNLKSNQIMFSQYMSPNQELYVIFYADFIASISNLSNYINYGNANIKSIQIFDNYFINGNSGYFYKIVFNVSSAGDVRLITKQNTLFIPIFKCRNTDVRFNNLSTEFALLWGFTNNFLENINTIAQGTTQSNQSASDLQGNTSDFETAADQYYTIENTYNNNMNSQLQNIDTSTGLSGFGGNFLTSANWVRVQYQNLTNGNPFGSLVTYGLTLGLALLLLGKVFL